MAIVRFMDCRALAFETCTRYSAERPAARCYLGGVAGGIAMTPIEACAAVAASRLSQLLGDFGGCVVDALWVVDPLWLVDVLWVVDDLWVVDEWCVAGVFPFAFLVLWWVAAGFDVASFD
jgi:hypothetical protein